MRIKVPGRICLFGEHSDWAGGYRRVNGDIDPGLAIITGTDQCLHADVRPHPGKLVLRATLEDGTRMPPFEVPMESGALLEVARTGGFFSYAAGVAYQILTHYQVRGIEIDNHRTDLPVKKGLSSSAAVCVLVARAFNRVYDLKLTVRGEMELAYLGEITTPSRCGRLDQGCAFGRPVLMHFDGDRIEVEELTVSRRIHLVVVDLKASKDTREILNRLNHCYPFAETEVQRNVQRGLGTLNRALVEQARRALAAGDAVSLGALMREAQSVFDANVAPACPEQLNAPVLHKVLAYEPIQPLIFGGKGVGSQGDGAVQLVARDADAQAKVMRILRKDFGMACLKLTLQSGQRVRKAVIPAAGLGTRLFPASKALRKELFPVVTPDGRAKTVLQVIAEEAVRAGIEEIAVLVQPDDLELFASVFHAPTQVHQYHRLSRERRQDADELLALGRRMTFLPQARQEGFGHAVWSAREWVGNEPFLLMLGDHLYRADNARNCARQLIDLFERTDRNVAGLALASEDEVHHYGCVGGQWRESRKILEITDFVEKPPPEYAHEHLAVEGLPRDRFLAMFGLYVLKPRIFELLGENIERNIREQGEYQLTSCLERLRGEDGFLGGLLEGNRFDVGNPEAYLAALAAFAASASGGMTGNAGRAP